MMKKILILILCSIAFLSIYNQRSFAEAAKDIQWTTFISPMNDYSLKVPQNWIAGSLSKIYVTLNSPENEKIKQSIKPKEMRNSGYMDDITIAYYSSGKNFAGYPTFKDWLEDKNNQFISDVKKIQFVGTEAWEMIMTGSRPGYVIMVEHNGHLYQIGFNNRPDKIALTDIDKEIIESFKFID